MVKRTSTPTLRTCADAVLQAAGDAALNGAWVLAGELPAGRRRVARAGLAAAIAVVSAFLEARSEGERTESERSGSAEATGDPIESEREEAEERAEDEPADPTEAQPAGLTPVIGALSGAALAIMISASFLQKRWLASLARDGHPHPHRSLAFRVMVISFAATLPARLLQGQGGDPKPG